MRDNDPDGLTKVVSDVLQVHPLGSIELHE